MRAAQVLRKPEKKNHCEAEEDYEVSLGQPRFDPRACKDGGGGGTSLGRDSTGRWLKQ
jgi:hypothetical protein